MPTPVNGLVEITLSGNCLGVDFANVYYYWDSSDSVVSDPPTIATQFNGFVANRLAVVTSVRTNYLNIKVRDVLGVTPDHDQTPSDTTGNVAGDCMPAFSAVRLDYAVATKETRRGYKRYTGVPETYNVDGQLNAAGLAAWQAEEFSFFQPLVAGALSYQPVIYGGPIPTNPTRSIANIVTAIDTRSLITSQVSRK